MSRKPSTLLFAVAAIATLVSSSLFASARLTYTMGDHSVPVAWPASAFPIQYEVDRRVMNTLPNAAAVIDRSFAAWSNAPDTTISFQSLGVGDGLVAGEADHTNTITLADGLFKDQYAIASTTNWYDTSGHLTQADIMIDATLVNSDYNMQHALTHEIGHLLGLDHSAVLSAIMFPYVPHGSDAPALDSDDRNAIANIYPKTDPTLVGGMLRGRVQGDSGGVFAAQVVAVNEKGEPVATILSDQNGDFVLQALPAGDYRLYAEPLDGPVDARNMAGIWRMANITAFPTHFCDSGTIHVDSGKVYGNLVVNTSGPPPTLNPRWIGVTTPTSDSFNLTSIAQTVRPGQSINVAVAGDGIVGGMTTFNVLNPGFHRTSDFHYAGNYVYATFSIAPDSPAGSAVILASNGATQEATLTGGLRIQAAPGRVRSAHH
ncbi:MAG TPA: matrixin family metalloprotease [Thermoanaerobaculia bacterium]